MPTNIRFTTTYVTQWAAKSRRFSRRLRASVRTLSSPLVMVHLPFPRRYEALRSRDRAERPSRSGERAAERSPAECGEPLEVADAPAAGHDVADHRRRVGGPPADVRVPPSGRGPELEPSEGPPGGARDDDHAVADARDGWAADEVVGGPDGFEAGPVPRSVGGRRPLPDPGVAAAIDAQRRADGAGGPDRRRGAGAAGTDHLVDDAARARPHVVESCVE